MTINNLIIIKGGSYELIKKALQQWIDLYSEQLDNKYSFELYRNGHESHIIKADNKLDNELFFYLVNYLSYPEKIEYKVEINGFTEGKDKKELLNQKLLVYISENDKEYDNVFVVTSNNKTYKIDFGGKVEKVNEIKTYNIPTFENIVSPEILKPNKPKISQIQQQQSSTNLKKRFKVISWIALCLFAISFLTLLKDNQTFYHVTFSLGLGIGIWFFSDYVMLRDNNFYTKCFIIALFYLGYGLILKNYFFNDIKKITELGIHS